MEQLAEHPQNSEKNEEATSDFVELPPLYHFECEQTGSSHRIILFQKNDKEGLKQKPLGKVIFTMNKGNIMHVDNLWVSENIRGSGMGHILLEQAIAMASELGAEKVLLEAEEDSKRHNKLGTPPFPSTPPRSTIYINISVYVLVVMIIFYSLCAFLNFF